MRASFLQPLAAPPPGRHDLMIPAARTSELRKLNSKEDLQATSSETVALRCLHTRRRLRSEEGGRKEARWMRVSEGRVRRGELGWWRRKEELSATVISSQRVQEMRK